MREKRKVKNYLKRYPIIVNTHKKIRARSSSAKSKIMRVKNVKEILRWKSYQNYVLNHQLDKSNFVNITQTKSATNSNKQLIAYYLPQYYQIAQNDAWFGKGFTEWSNAAKAVPQYYGHWQPHLPIDVGFYNLDNTMIMHRQVELAKMYGIHGFCFYYYWFSGGEKIMDKPLANWLKDKSIDFPFMLFWANEDWTNTWGESGDLGTKTYSAKMTKNDINKFVEDIFPYLTDERYIKYDGRPHLSIYQAKRDPFLAEFIDGVRKALNIKGIKNPYISIVFPDDFDTNFDPRDFGADAAVEFGSHLKTMPETIPKSTTYKKIMNPLAKLTEYDMTSYINNEDFIYKTDFPVFKGVMTNFDNTARKIYTGAQIFSISPDLYKKWLTKVIQKSETDQIFITAWNEWAEGMHLEPDQKYGYAYLQATLDALNNFEND